MVLPVGLGGAGYPSGQAESAGIVVGAGDEVLIIRHCPLEEHRTLLGVLHLVGGLDGVVQYIVEDGAHVNILHIGAGVEV